MNNMIKILLSVLMVSLSALVFPLNVHRKNIETKAVIVQEKIIQAHLKKPSILTAKF